MSRRVLVRAISFIAAALILGVVLNIQNARRAKRYEQVISDSYYYAFSEIVSGVTKMNYALEKCACSADSAMIASLCGEIFCQAETVSHALSRLPIRELSLENTTEFISQTGDFAYYVLKKAADGERIGEEERKTIIRLLEGTGDIVQNLRRISSRIESEKLDIATIDYGDEENEGISDIKELEREFSEYPVLVYDGPFSDETEGGKEYLTEFSEIGEGELLIRVARFLGTEKENLRLDSEWDDGGIKLKTFTDGERYVDITVRGGLIYKSVAHERERGKQLTVDEGIASAKKLLGELGYKSVIETYHTAYDDYLVINFASEKDGVTVYPDLIKISVSLSDGSVLNFDAAGYIKNHSEREIRDITSDEAHARKMVSEGIKILSYSPAIIPRDGEGEVLAHEFKCEMESGEHCIVYINADTLHEERILILIEDENGTLAM